MRETAANVREAERFVVSGCDGLVEEMQNVLSRRLPSFHRSAYRILGNAADAEDAVQDALLSAYKHLDQFRGRSQMATWLTAIVNNCARMHVRKRPRQAHVSLDEPLRGSENYSATDVLADRRPGPEEEYRKAEVTERLKELITHLSPPLRKAFQLRDLDGLTTLEAAQILGVSEGTLKAQLARARGKLGRLMYRALGPQRRTNFPRPRRTRMTGKQGPTSYRRTLQSA